MQAPTTPAAATTAEKSATRVIRPRSPRFDFSDVPRHWFKGVALSTHLVNGVNLLFPAGERFFVRSVHRFASRVKDPALKEQVRGFNAQEGRHANAHERYFETLEGQGYRIRGFLRVYEAFAFGFVERIAPEQLRLAVTVAAEHFTATLARGGLAEDVFAGAHPTMRALLMWHACEEIEHKAVAFDVLREVNPSYALRMAGLAAATMLLGGFWMLGTAMLVAQDRIGAARLLSEVRLVGDHQPFSDRVFGRAIRSYVSRSFHPYDERGDDELAREYLASVGLS
jgi:predicted metal-dependent hydrolase